MASPYDSAIDMFNLPRFGTGASPFPRRADPIEDARRRFLEGGGAQPEPQDFVAQRAMEAADPFGVMQEVENLRREREEQGFISDIASLNPSGETYSSDLLGLIKKNPRIAQSKGALGLIDVQRQLAPKPKDYTSQFRDPVYRATYQQKVKAGMDPDMAYEQTANEASNEEMAIELIRAGIPAERHGDLMTGGAFDRRKVAQAIYGAKPRAGYDLPLSGDAKEEFEGIVQELAQARAGAAEPTDDEKRQFLPARANTTWSEQEWADAYAKAKPLAQQRALTEASNRLNQFRQTYGDYYKLPEGLGMPPQPAPLAPQSAPAPLPVPGAPQTPPAPQNAPQGLIEAGNIDLTTRPIVQNADGTQSTVRSVSFEVNGKEVLVPTVSEDGRIMSDDEAFETFRRTGRHLGVFDSPQAANAYAKKLHDDYEQGRIQMKTKAPSGPNLAQQPSREQVLATAMAVAPQKLSVDAQAALKILGPEKLLDYYMAKTPENFTNPGDVRDARDERNRVREELIKEWGVDSSRATALDEAADALNELMGDYGYRTKREQSQQPRFINAQGLVAPVIKSIRLKNT